MWEEMSYNRFTNKRYYEEEIMDIEETMIITYGLYEDIYKINTFGVENLFEEGEE